MAHWTNLDAGNLWRSREHANLLIDELDLNILWDEFGIVGDLIVSSSGSTYIFFAHRFLYSLLQMTSLVQTFTASSCYGLYPGQWCLSLFFLSSNSSSFWYVLL